MTGSDPILPGFRRFILRTLEIIRALRDANPHGGSKCGIQNSFSSLLVVLVLVLVLAQFVVVVLVFVLGL